jgi:hypothetical protein
LLYHIVENGGDPLLSEVGVRKANDSIEVFTEDAVFFLHITEFLVFNQDLGRRLAEFASADTEIVDVEVPREGAGTEGNEGFLRGLLSGGGQLLIVREVEVVCVHLLVKYPGVSTACIEKSPDFLRGVVAHVDVSDV